jgi:hypothetical protein
MKQLVLATAATLLASGCAFHRTVELTFNPATQTNDKTTFTGVVWFQRAGVEGLTVGKRTGASSTTLTITKAATETQTETIAAIAEAAVKGAVKGAVPVP